MAAGGIFIIAMQVAGRFDDTGAEEVFLLAGNAVGHVFKAFAQPARREGIVAKIIGPVALHASGLVQLVILAKLGFTFLCIDGVGHAAVFANEGKNRDIAWAVGDVDHVFERHSSVGGTDHGVDVDGGVAVGALVDFENEAGLDGVVDHYADLADFAGVGEGQLILLGVMWRKRLLDKFAGENAIDVRGDLAATDHFGEAGADDVMLKGNFQFAGFTHFAGEGFELVEEIWQTGAKFDFRAQFAQPLVGKALERAVFHVAEQVVEVNGVLGDVDVFFGVKLGQFVDLNPKGFLVDPVGLEEGRLHVAGDDCFVEIPDTSEDVAGAQLSVLGVHEWQKVEEWGK